MRLSGSFVTSLVLSVLVAISAHAVEVQLALQYEQLGTKTYFYGETNLPDGTKIRIRLTPPGKPDGLQGSFEVRNGSFRSEGYSDRGIAFNGEWDVKIFSYFNKTWQAPSVLKKLKKYNGSLVRRDKYSSAQDYVSKIEITRRVKFGGPGTTGNISLKGIPDQGKQRYEQNYLEITRDAINIRAGRTTKSDIIAKAKKGDVFELRSRQGSWYEIKLFSGENRFVYHTLGRPIHTAPEPPTSETERRELYRQIMRIREKAAAGAESRHPTTATESLQKQATYERLLEDRYLLELYRRAGFSPAIHNRILVEGGTELWSSGE
jgi:hypothetical protein